MGDGEGLIVFQKKQSTSHHDVDDRGHRSIIYISILIILPYSAPNFFPRVQSRPPLFLPRARGYSRLYLYNRGGGGVTAREGQKKDYIYIIESNPRGQKKIDSFLFLLTYKK